MQHIRKQAVHRAKISTMPRQKSETSEQLKLYKIVSERQRVQQELILTEQRVQQLKQQLTELDSKIEETEKSIQELRQPSPNSPPPQSSLSSTRSTPTPAKTQAETPSKNSDEVSKLSGFQTFYLDI